MAEMWTKQAAGLKQQAYSQKLKGSLLLLKINALRPTATEKMRLNWIELKQALETWHQFNGLDKCDNF